MNKADLLPKKEINRNFGTIGWVEQKDCFHRAIVYGLASMKQQTVELYLEEVEAAEEITKTYEWKAKEMSQQQMNVESAKYSEYRTERLGIFETLIAAGAKPETLETMSEAFNLMSEGDAEKMMGFWREATALIQ